jgi:hypothetical protein
MQTPAFTFKRIDHWLLPSEFAKLSGVKNPTVVDRIKRGVITATMVDGFYLVDAAASEPKRDMAKFAPKAQPFRWPLDMPPAKELVWARKFAHGKHVRADALFKAVLFGDIPGWGVAGRVLIRREDAERIVSSK